MPVASLPSADRNLPPWTRKASSDPRPERSCIHALPGLRVQEVEGLSVEDSWVKGWDVRIRGSANSTA